MDQAYKEAGVDIEAGYEVVSRIKKHVKRTDKLGVMGSLGGFGGCFDLSAHQLKEPVLVSGTDGVGTKLMLAIEADKHDTIGIDCVAMCVNDIIAQGATPLYFLDYLAVGKNQPEKIETIIAGITEGCIQGDLALIGGETAEMPDMYASADYDLAGFAVGVVEKTAMLSGATIQADDLLIGLPSSGLHSNGFSLVRKILFKDHAYKLTDKISALDNEVLGDCLLTPTKIYVKTLQPLLEKKRMKGIAHITGGGFIENIPRMLPEGLAARLTKESWPVLPIFNFLQELGGLTMDEMLAIFNMGIGMVFACSRAEYPEIVRHFTATNQAFYPIGTVIDKKEQAIEWTSETTWQA